MHIISLEETGEIRVTAYLDESQIPENQPNTWKIDKENLPEAPVQTWEILDGVVTVNPEKLAAYHRSIMPSLTRYQFLRCLLENGFKSSDIEAQILTIEDEFKRELTLLGFKEATNFIRTDESIIVMQSVLNLTDERIDEMWQYALKL